MMEYVSWEALITMDRRKYKKLMRRSRDSLRAYRLLFKQNN